VHRRDERASHPCGGGRREKGGPLEPADHALGRSRGGFGTKISLVTDGNATPLVALLMAGQAGESTAFEETLTAVRVPESVTGPRQVAGDRGYSVERIRRWLVAHQIEPVIPYRKDQQQRLGDAEPPFDRAAYRRRNVIERCVGWLKECRRTGTRYGKLATSYLAMLTLAIIDRCFRFLHLPDTA